jgi:recombination protein RecA
MMAIAVKDMSVDQLIQHFGMIHKNPLDPVPRAGTGSLALDRCLGGGLPKGRIVEIWGAPSNGKSLLSMIMINHFIETGKKVCYLDTERSFMPEWGSQFMDLADPNFVLLQQETGTYGERILDMLGWMVEKNCFDLYIMDSKDAITFAPEMEGKSGDANMGVRAKRNTHFVRRLNQLLGGSSVSFIFISQVRADVKNSSYGDGLTTGGGWAMDHFANIQLKMLAPTKKDSPPTMLELHGKTTKNKTAINGQEFFLRVNNNEGVWSYDAGYDIVIEGKEVGFFTTAEGKPWTGSGHLHCNGVKLGTKEEAIEVINLDPTLQTTLYTAMREKNGWDKPHESATEAA